MMKDSSHPFSRPHFRFGITTFIKSEARVLIATSSGATNHDELALLLTVFVLSSLKMNKADTYATLTFSSDSDEWEVAVNRTMLFESLGAALNYLSARGFHLREEDKRCISESSGRTYVLEKK